MDQQTELHQRLAAIASYVGLAADAAAELPAAQGALRDCIGTVASEVDAIRRVYLRTDSEAAVAAALGALEAHARRACDACRSHAGDAAPHELPPQIEPR